MQNSALSIVNSALTLAICEDASPIGVVIGATAITVVSEEFFKAVIRPEIYLYAMLRTSVLELALDNSQCGVWLFNPASLADADGVLLDNMSLPYSPNSTAAWCAML